MSVFLFKSLSLLVRTLARPLINWVSYYNRMKMQESENKFVIFIRNRLENLGQKFNYYNTFFNRKLFKLADTQPIKPLTAEKALERGAELVSEFIVYSILLTLPTYEIYRQTKNNKIKEQKKKDFLIGIQKEVDRLIESHYENRKDIKEMIVQIKDLNDSIYLV
jgi:hypothetical protein